MIGNRSTDPWGKLRIPAHSPIAPTMGRTRLQPIVDLDITAITSAMPTSSSPIPSYGHAAGGNQMSLPSMAVVAWCLSKLCDCNRRRRLRTHRRSQPPGTMNTLVTEDLLKRLAPISTVLRPGCGAAFVMVTRLPKPATKLSQSPARR